MKNMQQYGMMAGVMGALLVSSSVRAAIVTNIIDPVSVSASSFYSNPPAVRATSLTIDGSGLSDSTIVETGDPVPVAWPTHTDDTVSSQTMWLSQGTDTSPSITWDLGAVYELAGFHLWNYNESGGLTPRGVRSAHILVSDVANFATFTDMGTMTFTQASGLNTYTGEDYALRSMGRYVRFTNLKDSLFSGNDGFVGLSEIRFEALPEPSIVALVGVGALVLRRRSRNAVVE